MEITGEYWRSERCGLLLAKPCCSTLGLAKYLLWSVYDVRLIIVQTASAQFAKKEEPVKAPRRYVISKSCFYVPVRADYIQVWPGVLPYKEISSAVLFIGQTDEGEQ